MKIGDNQVEVSRKLFPYGGNSHFQIFMAFGGIIRWDQVGIFRNNRDFDFEMKTFKIGFRFCSTVCVPVKKRVPSRSRNR